MISFWGWWIVSKVEGSSSCFACLSCFLCFLVLLFVIAILSIPRSNNKSPTLDFFFLYTRTPRTSESSKIILKLELTLPILIDLQQIWINHIFEKKLESKSPTTRQKTRWHPSSGSITSTSVLVQLWYQVLYPQRFDNLLSKLVMLFGFMILNV